MNGQACVARVALYNHAGEQVAAPGDTCERVAASSLPVLLRLGWIAPASDADPAGDGAAAAPGSTAAEEGEVVAFGALPSRPTPRRRRAAEEVS